MRKYVIFVMLIIGNYLFGQEWPYYIDSIPFNNYSFEEGDYSTRTFENFCSKATILGWSRDGKILVFYHYGNVGSDYKIIDLVNDKIIFNSNNYYMDQSNSSAVRDNILNEARRYNIESVSGEYGIFPYSTGNGVEYNISIEETPIEYDHMRITAYIYIGSFPNRKKLINNIAELYFWNDSYRRKLAFWYVKSPFENRIAVIAVVPEWISGVYDVTNYTIDFFGCNLNVGF
jgi:hypothetical protein